MSHTQWASIGSLCEKCGKKLLDNEISEDEVGLMEYSEQVLDNGSVLHINKCNMCGYTEKFVVKPDQAIRKTGISRCAKCGYEYFYCRLESTADEMLELLPYYSKCPNCGIRGYQTEMFESHGPLRHDHGEYGTHPITRKHRALKNDKVR